MKVHFRRRISRQKYSILYNSFVADIPARKAAGIASVNRKTVNRYFTLFREVVLQEAYYERTNISLRNGVEIDESYFGARRVRGKRGRGAGRKVIVFGLLKRNGNVYTNIIKSAEKTGGYAHHTTCGTIWIRYILRWMEKL